MTSHARSVPDRNHHTRGSRKALLQRAGRLFFDLDTKISDEVHIVQLTPPGSGCSIHLSSGIHNMPPEVLEGLQLVVSDIEAAALNWLRGV